MASFSLRQRISYRFLKDPSPVSFHLIQFVEDGRQQIIWISKEPPDIMWVCT